MAVSKKKILYVSDLYYQAEKRTYYEEDLFLSGALRDAFDLLLCHPCDTQAFEGMVDGIIFRNTGPTLYYQQAYEAFKARARTANLKVYNPLAGKADMQGKDYFVDLFQEGFPVIPTIDRAEDLHRLPHCQTYVSKLKNGADSVGMEFIDLSRVGEVRFETNLLQPKIDFLYEVSFYFIDGDFHYALYAPDRSERWRLEPYAPTECDLEFARKFIQWNALSHGIQRVDACRTQSGDLLLVELEDLNPFLSLSLISEEKRATFVECFKRSLNNFLAA